MILFGWTMEEWACVFAYDARDHSEMTFKHALETRLWWMKRNLGQSPKASLIIDVEQDMDWTPAIELFEIPMKIESSGPRIPSPELHSLMTSRHF